MNISNRIKASYSFLLDRKGESYKIEPGKNYLNCLKRKEGSLGVILLLNLNVFKESFSSK